MANYSLESGFFLSRLDWSQLLRIEWLSKLGPRDTLSSLIWASRFSSEGRPSLRSRITRHGRIVPILVIAISLCGADLCSRLRPMQPSTVEPCTGQFSRDHAVECRYILGCLAAFSSSFVGAS